MNEATARPGEFDLLLYPEPPSDFICRIPGVCAGDDDQLPFARRDGGGQA